jgi:predicted MFS family arabinose efflux permease
MVSFGSLLGGALGTWIGVRGTLLVAVIGMTAATGWLLLSPLRHANSTRSTPKN